MKKFLTSEQMKAKYHEKFRKNINHKKSYFEQLLERAQNEYSKHPAFNPYIRENGVTLQDREDLKALNELIELYQSRVGLKEIEYTSC